MSVTTSLISEAVSLVCGLILPEMILSSFGSAYNGMTQSISQFISYISLMKAGIGGATAVALYKPLAENDTQEISEILVSTLEDMDPRFPPLNSEEAAKIPAVMQELENEV